MHLATLRFFLSVSIGNCCGFIASDFSSSLLSHWNILNAMPHRSFVESFCAQLQESLGAATCVDIAEEGSGGVGFHLNAPGGGSFLSFGGYTFDDDNRAAGARVVLFRVCCVFACVFLSGRGPCVVSVPSSVSCLYELCFCICTHTVSSPLLCVDVFSLTSRLYSFEVFRWYFQAREIPGV